MNQRLSNLDCLQDCLALAVTKDFLDRHQKLPNLHCHQRLPDLDCHQRLPHLHCHQRLSNLDSHQKLPNADAFAESLRKPLRPRNCSLKTKVWTVIVHRGPQFLIYSMWIYLVEWFSFASHCFIIHVGQALMIPSRELTKAILTRTVIVTQKKSFTAVIRNFKCQCYITKCSACCV